MAKAEPTATPRCKVMLVEDHPMFREHLGQLINRDLDMVVCGEADNIRDAMQLIQKTKPDIAIVDVTLKGSSGLELLKDLKAQGIELNVLVVSMHDEELYAERALRAGARGYIIENEASSEVVKAIRQVMAGEVYASKRVTSKLLERMTQKRADASSGGMAMLADRELEVFQVLGRGKNTLEIAKALNLGESTVETYRARINRSTVHLAGGLLLLAHPVAAFPRPLGAEPSLAGTPQRCLRHNTGAGNANQGMHLHGTADGRVAGLDRARPISRRSRCVTMSERSRFSRPMWLWRSSWQRHASQRASQGRSQG